ncbi:MAG: PD40 domain-containing protein [Flavobacteriales bacterium]|nr:PD40 domain-containing protein [Flavobacteriales bacterium]MEB2341580.1 hypothetical protein [Flavobacteriia bacterium]
MLGPSPVPRILAAAALALALPLAGRAQDGDKALKARADALFDKGDYIGAWPMYSQLVSLAPQDHELNYKFGACTIYSGEDKAKAIGYLRFAVGGPATPQLAWYFLARACQLDYRFDDALAAYGHFKGTADKKLLARFPVDAMEQQCRNGKYLLNNLKDIEVLNKVEVDASDFFRFYDLSDIGGKIVVTPDELLSSLDRKSGERFLVYLPKAEGTIYFSSYGKDGKTGRDIYRTELMPNGSYAPPRKLAGYINTDQDEDYAVMAPDGKSFFFCSKGHNSMGGYDVFKSIYDPGMDTFSAPENMDFAVNTPADELLYVVGPDGTQACFASDRDSRQGQVNVYRVGTSQTPLNLVVMKGTYTSPASPSGRNAARIIVEDEVTRQRVAEAATDENGAYVLVLPKGGRYKFLVQDEGMDRAVWTEVEVPPAHQAQAFAQEIRLTATPRAQLDVMNHFDSPLGDDVMALALDDIRRRSRLDITVAPPVAQEKPVEEDPVQQAGFDGTVTMAKATAMARQEAEALAQRAQDQERRSRAAMELALANTAEAESQSQEAARLLGQADKAAQGTGKEQLLRQAGEAKQRSMEARFRALAALETGRKMREASAGTVARENGMHALATRLAQAKPDDKGIVSDLKQLKAVLDKNKGPEAAVDDQERMRAAAVASKEDAARQMRQAMSLREEEGQLADRVRNAAAEADKAKGRKKEEIGTQLAVLNEQHAALKGEVAEAFATAMEKEDAALMALGQVELMKYLAGAADLGNGPVPDEQSLRALDQRLKQVREGNQALTIDRQYLPMTTAALDEREKRTFDWGRRDAMARTSISPTNTTSPNLGAWDTSGAVNATEGGRTGQSGRADQADLADASKASGNLDHVDQGGEGSPVDVQARHLERRDTAGAAPGAASGGRKEQAGTEGAPMIRDQGPATPEQGTRTQGTVGEEIPQKLAEGNSATEGAAEERAFVLANKLAELEQLRQAERNKAKRDSLDIAITEQKSLMAALLHEQKGAAADAGKNAAVPNLVYLAFDMATLDEQLVEEVFPGFEIARRSILDMDVGPGEKAARLRALELRLVDSVDVQAARALAYLEAHPDSSADVLPRLERWRRIKEGHRDRANQALADAGQEYVASETRAMEEQQMEQQAAAHAPAPQTGLSPTPHNDAYISVEDDLERVYSSVITPRSKKDVGAIAQKDRDLALAAAMQAEIDSMREVLSGIVAAKEYAKLEQKMDRKVDDLLIHTVDMGQRTAFISRSEFEVAKDSAKVLSKALGAKGLAPDDPLLQMAGSYEQTAQAGMARAKTLRKQADDANDIFRRNSLYRQAYAEELKALRDMDRSLTVRSYLLRGTGVPGEAISYEEVEARMFPASMPGTAADQTAEVDGPAGKELAVRDSVPDDGVVAEQPKALPDGQTTASGDQPPPIPVTPVAGAADSVALATYLDRFYYLDAQERRLVESQEEERRYFLMKGRSLQDRADATATQDEAEAAGQLAQVLRSEASTLKQQGSDAGVGQEDPAVQVGKLELRAAALEHRADSLRQVSEALLKAADMADAQAASWMERLPAERSVDIMGLEQDRRRTEPVLARTRPRTIVAPQQPSSSQTDLAGKAGQTHMDAGDRPVQGQVVDASTAQDVAESAPRVGAAVPDRLTPRPSVVHPAVEFSAKPLAADVFAFRESPAPREAPIPIDAPMPTGVVYKVQVGAFRNELPMEAFSDMAPISGEHAGNGLVRYTAGMFTTAEAAREAGAKVRGRGYRDAFVVAYMDGRRVSLREAMQAERRALAVAPAAVADLHANASAGQPDASKAPGQAVDLTDRNAQAAAEEAVLARYPATAQEVLSAFKPSNADTAYYNDPSAAPAKQVETVKGLFFTVQVGVYSKPTPLDRLFNITPLNSELTANAKIRYTTGRFLQEAAAVRRRTTAVAQGVTDAFVTAYLNGKRIPVRDARALLAKFGTAILADTSVVEE